MALRLMTFCVHMQPLSDGEGGTDDGVERADEVADAILRIPALERPDVIAFTGAYDDDGRHQLRSRLEHDWPHTIVAGVPFATLGACGLAVFSRLSFHTLATGGVFVADEFVDDTGGPSKGVGVVQLDAPDAGLPLILAFATLQASDEAEDQHSDIREAQLETVWRVIESSLDPDASQPHAVERVIVCGDLNVRGDSGAVSGEWADVFARKSTALTRNMGDAWRMAMHPPGDDADHDPGFTQVSHTSGTEQRVDYFLFGVEHEQPLVPQHIFSRIRNVGDHYALEAVVASRSDHCQPATAGELANVTPVAGGTVSSPSSLRVIEAEFEFEGSYQWVFVREPGTYTFWSAPDMRVEAYAFDDLSNPLDPAARTELTLFAGTAIGDALDRYRADGRWDPSGVTVAADQPFYLAVSPRKKKTTGKRIIAVLEHHGETAETAIELTPNDWIQSGHPLGEPLGATDTCWFRAHLPATFGGLERAEEFVVRKPGDVRVAITILDASQTELSTAEGTQHEISASVDTIGDEKVFVTVRRAKVHAFPVEVNWASNVSYLMLDKNLGLYIKEETAGLGSDEVTLHMDIDGVPVIREHWDDADEGETWPGLADRIAAACRAHMPVTNRVPFADAIGLLYVEEDTLAKGMDPKVIYGVAPGEQDVVEREVSLPVADTLGSGTYTFFCSLTRRK